jgi:hypothetical protein
MRRKTICAQYIISARPVSFLTILTIATGVRAITVLATIFYDYNQAEIGNQIMPCRSKGPGVVTELKHPCSMLVLDLCGCDISTQRVNGEGDKNSVDAGCRSA